MKIQHVFALLLACLLGGLTGCGTFSGFELPDDLYYGGSYRNMPDSDRNILEHGYIPEIRAQTNDWHVAIRTPIHLRDIRSQDVEGARDSWRSNGAELAYGRPLLQSEDDDFYSRLNWEVNGGFLQATEREATTNVIRRATPFGIVEGFQRRTGSQKFLPTAGVGLNWMGGVKLGQGTQYSSLGIGVSAGYRTNFELDETFYFDISVLMGL